MKRMVSALLAALFMAVMWAGCGPSSSSHQTSSNEGGSEPGPTVYATPDTSVKGKWVLTESTIMRERNKYASLESESVYTVELNEHHYSYTYTPDMEDPSDGPTPYTAAFGCEFMLPATLKPGDTVRFSLIAFVDHDGKQGHSGGICCTLIFSGLTPEPVLKSDRGYDYSDPMYYPVYAGSPVEYGHLDDKYRETMDDYIDVTLPVITPDMDPSAYSELRVVFASSAGESEFVYAWTPGE